MNRDKSELMMDLIAHHHLSHSEFPASIYSLRWSMNLIRHLMIDGEVSWIASADSIAMMSRVESKFEIGMDRQSRTNESAH